MRFAETLEESPYVDSEPKPFVLPAPLTWEELLQPVDYSDNLLGNRFLEYGQGLILYGPAGCGKSVAGLQVCAEWSAQLDGLHITPARPLKIVIIQTEDSRNDFRETLPGILKSHLFTHDKIGLVKQNLIILPPVPGGTELDLGKLLNAAALMHKPDILYANPLLAWCSGDPTRELGGLLYQTVDPIIKLHRVAFMGVHHTPKTNNRDTSGYGAHDYQYLAAGDARVANWPRAMIQIEPVAKDVYRFRVSKRWQRTGWTWNGQPTKERYFQWAKDRVAWIDARPEAAEEAQNVEDYKRILEVLPPHDQPGISRERIHNLAKNKFNLGKNRADSWLKLALEDGAVDRKEKRNPKTKRKEAFFRRKEAANGA
jgi:hypothetical protein